MTRHRRSLLVVSALLLAGACGSDEPTGPTSLAGGRWRLNSLRTPEGITTTVNPDRYTLEFLDEGRISARADCNVCTGSYDTRGSIVITIGPLACTRALCAPDSRGNEYVALLNTSKLFAQEGETLVLLSDTGTLLYRP
jgi:heat shock protein HslJ